MIEQTIAEWHRFLKGGGPEVLDELLHDDCVFFSPIVFSPQRGKELTKMYLMAAGQTFPGDAPEGSGTDSAVDGSADGDTVTGGFRYTKKVLAGNHAVLEFETTMQGKYVNGVDIITCDDNGKIIEFRVMIRPLQAVNLVHQQMAAMLELMKGAE